MPALIGTVAVANSTDVRKNFAQQFVSDKRLKPCKCSTVSLETDSGGQHSQSNGAGSPERHTDSGHGLRAPSRSSLALLALPGELFSLKQ